MDFSDSRLDTIRRAEAYSHTEAYERFPLFQPGSWLSKPVKTVMEQMSNFQDHRDFCGLDLGCGVGRNCIPVLQAIPHSHKQMDCVDILPLAIEKLSGYADLYHLSGAINPILSSVEQFEILENRYDLIIAVSVLEHLSSLDVLKAKLLQIREGLRSDGIACLILNTSIEETDIASNESVPVQFEINLPTACMMSLMEQTYKEMQLLKSSVVHYQYETWRKSGLVRLDTDVLTYVIRKRN